HPVGSCTVSVTALPLAAPIARDHGHRVVRSEERLDGTTIYALSKGRRTVSPNEYQNVEHQESLGRPLKNPFSIRLCRPDAVNHCCKVTSGEAGQVRLLIKQCRYNSLSAGRGFRDSGAPARLGAWLPVLRPGAR